MNAKNKLDSINYADYLRKSSESEDRQALSIDSQRSENKKRAKDSGMKVTETFEESKSAKQPGRSEFDKMMKSIEKGKIQGIICWSLDRLARNPIDGARIIWAMQLGLLKHINTASGDHYPNDNVIVLNVQFGMANQFILDLSKNVKRGLKKKAEMGYPSGIAKVGYLNDFGKKGERKIIIDQDRFHLVKEIWDLFLTGQYSVSKLHHHATNILDLKIIRRKKLGGKPIKLSRLYELLGDPFYAGYFFHDGVRYEVNPSVPRMITEEDFKKAQKFLGRDGSPKKVINYEFGFATASKCGTCNGTITGELKMHARCHRCKNKFSCIHNKNCPKCGLGVDEMPYKKTFVYHRCVRSTHGACADRSNTNEVEIVSELLKEMNGLEMSPELTEWCISNLRILEKDDSQSKEKIKEKQVIDYEKKEAEMLNLVRLKTQDLIDENAFVSAQNSLKQEMSALKNRIDSWGGFGARKEAVEAEKKIAVLPELRKIIENGTADERRELMELMCSNLILKDRKVSVIKDKCYKIIEKGLLSAKAKNPAFEPRFIQDVSSSNQHFEDVIPIVLRTWDNVRKAIIQENNDLRLSYLSNP